MTITVSGRLKTKYKQSTSKQTNKTDKIHTQNKHNINKQLLPLQKIYKLKIVIMLKKVYFWEQSWAVVKWTARINDGDDDDDSQVVRAAKFKSLCRWHSACSNPFGNYEYFIIRKVSSWLMDCRCILVHVFTNLELLTFKRSFVLRIITFSQSITQNIVFLPHLNFFRQSFEKLKKSQLTIINLL